MKIIDGQRIAEEIEEEQKKEVIKIFNHTGRYPHLAVILVGDDPASLIYITKKQEAAERVNIKTEVFKLPKTTELNLIKLIKKLNDDKNVDGILVQLPLPKTLNQEKILSKIDPAKDVDGLTPFNKELLVEGKPLFIPPTTFATLKLLEKVKFNFKNKNVALVGYGEVGRSLASLLLNKGSIVHIANSKTPDISQITKSADLVISAVGRPNLIKANMVKKDSVIIDVGISRVDGKVTGDVDFKNVSKKASAITPVPGGVGPMTVSAVLENTIKAVQSKKGLKNQVN